MSAAIELFGAVFTTAGGTRYHADPACYALTNGRSTQAYWAGAGLYGQRWYGAQYLDGLYPLVRRSTISAQQFSFTACRVCVPPALALPATGETYGHEPVCGNGWYGGGEIVCARCTEPLPLWLPRSRRRPVSVHWPCTSALVLGLVVVDAERWNRRYPVGTPVHAYPGARWDEPLRTTTRAPAWRLGHGDSVVSVNGHAGGIALTHVDPRDGA